MPAMTSATPPFNYETFRLHYAIAFDPVNKKQRLARLLEKMGKSSPQTFSVPSTSQPAERAASHNSSSLRSFSTHTQVSPNQYGRMLEVGNEKLGGSSLGGRRALSCSPDHERIDYTARDFLKEGLRMTQSCADLEVRLPSPPVLIECNPLKLPSAANSFPATSTSKSTSLLMVEIPQPGHNGPTKILTAPGLNIAQKHEESNHDNPAFPENDAKSLLNSKHGVGCITRSSARIRAMRFSSNTTNGAIQIDLSQLIRGTIL
ncbi:hypothetical protein BX600DRAFT_440145 [Xylariales sp. PMI_506]|nr:hypothetical protein BX600DRAFT_440145 [Xylariales sp. PMI_506]